MSIKTLRKRIALVAVSALGAGLMSVVAVPTANAGAGDQINASDVSLTAAAANVNTTGVCVAATGLDPASPRVFQVGGTQTVALATNTNGRFVLSGNAEWITVASGATYNAPKNILTTTATGSYVFEVKATGNFTLSITTSAAPSVTLKTWYFTAVSACSTAVSAATSFVQVGKSASNVETSTAWATRQSALNNDAPDDGSATNLDTSLDSYTTFANDATAYIAVRARDGYTANIGGSTNTLIVSCTNGAKVGGTGLSFYSTSSFGATTGTSNIPVIQATSGVPMTTVCTVSVEGVTLATKTIKFSGDLAKIVIAESRNGDVEAGTAGRFSYKLYDSADNLLSGTVGSLTDSVPLVTISEYVNANYYATSNAYVQAYGADANPAYQTAGYAGFTCTDYGTAKVKMKKSAASGATITSNEITIACGGAPYTWTASLDKASYKQGEIATLTITAKDYAGGVPAYGAVLSGLSVALPNMTYVVQPSASDVETTPRAGVWTYTYTVNNGSSVAGSYNGAVKVTVGSTSSQYNKAVTIPYVIQGDGAVSNAEVLAAIVKLIASINKQIKALQKSLRR